MQKKQIDLSIIIVNFGNTKNYTKKCLDSLEKAVKKINTEIIVVDNISRDGTLQMIKKDYPEVIYIRKEKAYGFGANNNFGIKVAIGRYVLFLNNDTEIIDKNIFSEMIEWMDKNPQVAVSSSGLLDPDKKTIQASGGAFPNLFRVIAWMTFLNNSYHHNLNYYNKAHNQDWVTGAFYMVRKEVLDKVRYFDEDYDAYVEEVDLSYRIKKLGYEISYLPNWKIVHYGGISYGSEKALIYEMKNLKLFYKKHYPKWQLPILNIIIKFGCLLRIIIFGLINPKLSKIYAKAINNI